MILTDAIRAFKYLNGIVCLYKPASITPQQLHGTLRGNLCKDLNALKCRDLRKYVEISGDTTKPLNVEVKENYADHPNVVGPRYIERDIQARFAMEPSIRMSGVCLLGINTGIPLAAEYYSSSPLRVYHITGQLGIVTDNLFADGKVLYKGTYDYVKKELIDRIVSATQSVYQKNIYNTVGIDSTSQTAYNIAVAGPVRPIDKDVPMVYNIKCTNLNLPYFTLEIACVNETEDLFAKLVTNIGLKLKCKAITVSIQCMRNGFFSVQDALLRKHWRLEHIVDNIKKCNEIMANTRKMDGPLEEINECRIPSEEPEYMDEPLVPTEYNNIILEEGDEHLCKNGDF